MQGFNLAHLVASNFYGGPERQIVTHLRHARDMGYQPLVVSFAEAGNDNQVLAKAAASGLATHLLATSGPFDARAVRRLARELVRREIDVLVSHGYKSNVIGRLATWLAGIPTVAVSRGWTGESARIRLYERLDKIFLRLADRVVAVSAGQAEKVRRIGVRARKLRVIRNSIDLAGYPGPSRRSLAQRCGFEAGSVVVATAGRLSPEKNQQALVEAAARLTSVDERLRFVIFGEGAMRGELEELVRARGLAGRVVLPGFAPNVRSLLHDVDIFVLPSLTEGLPNVVLEAFACAKPVVATAVGGTPEVVEHGKSGLLVPAGDTAGLARAIKELAADRAMRERFGAHGRSVLEASYGFEVQMAGYHALYRECAHSRQGAGAVETGS